MLEIGVGHELSAVLDSIRCGLVKEWRKLHDVQGRTPTRSQSLATRSRCAMSCTKSAYVKQRQAQLTRRIYRKDRSGSLVGRVLALVSKSYRSYEIPEPEKFRVLEIWWSLYGGIGLLFDQTGSEEVSRPTPTECYYDYDNADIQSTINILWNHLFNSEIWSNYSDINVFQRLNDVWLKFLSPLCKATDEFVPLKTRKRCDSKSRKVKKVSSSYPSCFE